MNNYQRIALIMGVVFAIVIWNSFVSAQDQRRRAMLRGLQGCGVIVGNLKPEIERDGLTNQNLQTDTELKFRMAGNKILSPGAGVPYFYLTVTVMKSQSGFYIFNISAALGEDVLLIRNGDTIWGTTWDDNHLGMTSDLSDIRQRAKDMVDIFINDYLAANPK